MNFRVILGRAADPIPINNFVTGDKCGLCAPGSLDAIPSTLSDALPESIIRCQKVPWVGTATGPWSSNPARLPPGVHPVREKIRRRIHHFLYNKTPYCWKNKVWECHYYLTILKNAGLLIGDNPLKKSILFHPDYMNIPLVV